MLNKLYPHRFELFFISLIAILFGSVFFPGLIFEKIVQPIFIIINVLSGIVMISKTKRLKRLFLLIVTLLCFFFVTILTTNAEVELFEYMRLAIYSLFYVIFTYVLIKQVWRAKLISKNVIIGLMSGYICIGLVCFFNFLAIEMLKPNSFSGINSNSTVDVVNSLLYYSYITLLTIGYGEITPITVVAQKASILTGLLGQFYVVILTSVIIGKYINQLNKEKHLD